MPAPIIIGLWALAGVAGAGGAGAGVKGVSDKSKAKRLDGETMAAYKAETAKHNREVDHVNRLLATYGETKIETMRGPMSTFVRYYRRVANVAFDGATVDVPMVGREAVTAIDAKSFSALSESVKVFKDIGIGLGVGQAASAGTTFAVANLAAASTGTAIAELSGAAATNATLAYLGGGSLAVGGGGVAAGTALLTGVAAAPVLLVGGGLMMHRGTKSLNEAKVNAAKVEAEITKLKRSYGRLNVLAEMAVNANTVVQHLAVELRLVNRELGRITSTKTDFRGFTNPEKETLAVAIGLAKTVRAIIDLPLSTKAGHPSTAAKSLIATQLALINLSLPGAG